MFRDEILKYAYIKSKMDLNVLCQPQIWIGEIKYDKV